VRAAEGWTDQDGAAVASMPTALVQQQLGHAGPMLTLTRYGAFIPQREDRDHWARVVEKAQARSAKGSAMTVNR
jgi:hypothetical protein